MKHKVLSTIALALAFPLSSFATTLENAGAHSTNCTVSTSGNSCTLSVTGNAGTFEEVITGSPATTSIVIKGCMDGGTCDTLDTNTGTTSANRVPGSWTTLYRYFTVIASWTGGTNVSIRVNALVAIH